MPKQPNVKLINRSIKKIGFLLFCAVVTAVSAQSLSAQYNGSRSTEGSSPVVLTGGARGTDSTELPVVATANFTENFDDITTLPGSGWSLQNLSSPVGTSNWFQGTTTVFTSQTGAANSYIGANYNNTTGANTISNWLLTPPIAFRNGDRIVFWTRKATPNPSDFPDRLQVRLSLNGASTNVGATATSVGDFTTVLQEINPTLVAGGYPVTWTRYLLTISGVPANDTVGRIGFRYFVTNGGPDGANSDYIGIDTFSYFMASTAANSSIAGRVVANGKGLVSAKVELTGTGGTPRTAMTNALGNFVIDQVESGATYVINVSAKKYTFAPQVVSVTDNVSGLTFTAQ